MADQATLLRDLVVRHTETVTQRQAAPRPNSCIPVVAIASGKGGVGKTHIALNLAVGLAQAGRRVGLLDANPGLGNVELLCGLNSYWNLSHVLTGARTFPEVIQYGPANIEIVTGAASLMESPGILPSVSQQLTAWEQSRDVIVVDTGHGHPASIRRWMRSATVAWLVTTPEITAIADAYALLKHMNHSQPGPRWELLVNRAETAQQARDVQDRLRKTAQVFLREDLAAIGSLPEDAAVAQAVRTQTPFMLGQPRSAISLTLTQLVKRLLSQLEHPGLNTRRSFFERLLPSPEKQAA